MQDKLSYLSKYTDSSKKPSEKSKKKKKKSKKRKDKETLLRDLDEDDIPKITKEDEDEDYGEDGPVVCLPDGVSATSVIDGKNSTKRSLVNSSNFVPVHETDFAEGEGDSNSPAKNEKNRKNRYDSEEESDDSALSPPRNSRRRKGSKSRSNNVKSKSKRRSRHRHDTDSDASSISRSRLRRRRYDSEDDLNSEKDIKSRQGKTRRSHDQRSMSSSQSRGRSPSSEHRKNRRKQRRRHDSSSEEDEPTGLNVVRHDTNSTTYRDSKTGLKVDMQNRYENVLLNHQKKKIKSMELNKGKVQKEKEVQLKENERFVKAQPFARTVDNLDIETGLRDQIRTEDPMAKRSLRKIPSSSGSRMKPIYKGPAPKPNRFNIRPGYRWDGVDRGNGFEDKVLALTYSQAQRKEDAYKWSTADM